GALTRHGDRELVAAPMRELVALALPKNAGVRLVAVPIHGDGAFTKVKQVSPFSHVRDTFSGRYIDSCFCGQSFLVALAMSVIPLTPKLLARGVHTSLSVDDARLPLVPTATNSPCGSLAIPL